MNLNEIATRPAKNTDEDAIRNGLDGLVKQIGELQLRLYAESKKSLLVILQGMDASGKDGAIKDVFADINPMGSRVINFKKPTSHELSHNFLWRIHANVPPAGMIHIFNRSHYEDILVPTIEGLFPAKVISPRYRQINDFERMLEENNTTILKFFLHVSHKEQQERLQERLDDPKKFWKHKDADWETTKKWDQYMKVYETIFDRCNQPPWHVIPSDKNWFKEYIMAEKVLEALKQMDPKYPGLITSMK